MSRLKPCGQGYIWIYPCGQKYVIYKPWAQGVFTTWVWGQRKFTTDKPQAEARGLSVVNFQWLRTRVHVCGIHQVAHGSYNIYYDEAMKLYTIIILGYLLEWKLPILSTKTVLNSFISNPCVTKYGARCIYAYTHSSFDVWLHHSIYLDLSLTTGLYEKYTLVKSFDVRCESGIRL